MKSNLSSRSTFFSSQSVRSTSKKKKKVELDDEEYIVNKTYDKDQGNLANLAGDRIPIPNFHY